MSQQPHLRPVRSVRMIEPVLLRGIYNDDADFRQMLDRIDEAEAVGGIPPEAHDRPASAGEGIWLLLGAAAAIGWIAGLAYFGVFG
jgi:hypothetical protein